MRTLSTLAVTTATLITLAIAPANATHKGGAPHGQDGSGDSGDSQTLEAILNLLEPRTIFATSTRYTGGGFGGLAGADIICQDLAAIIHDGHVI